MFVFGINIPLPEILFIALVLLIVVAVMVIINMRNMNRHMRILENQTLEIKRFEEQELSQVRRFEIDMQKFEADEASMFVGKVMPTVAKLENYAAVQLMKGSRPQDVRGEFVKRGIQSDLATRVVNNITYYLETFHKMPKRAEHTHHTAARKIQLRFPKAKK